MEILIGVQKITKSFTHRVLFKDLTFTIEAGEKVGLIGPNGAGKSTLLKILARQADIDSGNVSYKKGLRVGYLSQVPEFQQNATVHSTLLEGSRDPDDWEEIARTQEVSSKLELSNWDPNTLVSSLSGGWKKRLALARELVRAPDLLLLDEPTNHLDVESIIWLEEFIAQSELAVLTITHDRVFLQEVASRILELDRRHPDGILSVKGDYLHFVTVREAQLSAQEVKETKLKNTLRRETEWLRRGAKARHKKQTARINATYELSDEVSDLQSRNKSGVVKLDFQGAERNPKKLIEAKNISKSYGEKLVVPKLDLLVSPKSRVGLMGPNGAGKSTLIKLLSKMEISDTGEIYHADNLKISYFEQNRDALDPNITLFKTICPQGDHVHFAGQYIHARSYLARFLFDFDQMETEVRKLSGGEQSRLLLAKLMLVKANVLVLDEPTNDLDMPTLEVLTEVLQEFDGAIILVTHDRYFLDQMTNQILAFGIDSRGHKVIDSMVGLDQWTKWFDEQRILKTQIEKGVATNKLESPPQVKTKTKKLSFKDQYELDNMEENIQKAEAFLVQLNEEFVATANKDPKSLAEISKKIANQQSVIEKMYSRWEELGN